MVSLSLAKVTGGGGVSPENNKRSKVQQPNDPVSPFTAGKATCVQGQRVSRLPYPELTTFIHILISTK